LGHEVINRGVIEDQKATEAHLLVSKAAGKTLRQKRAKGEATDTAPPTA
jgi:hypothetical protein